MDNWRNQALYFILKPFWPEEISPNQVTWSRIILSCGLILLLFYFGIEDRTIILGIFLLGILTDFIDGPIARCKNKVSEFGAMLDPIADRLLIMPIAIYSLLKCHRWLLLFLIFAEVAEFIASAWSKSKGFSVKSNIFGKTKMVLQSLLFLAVLIVWPAPPFQFLFNILWLSILLSLLSIWQRINEAYKIK